MVPSQDSVEPALEWLVGARSVAVVGASDRSAVHRVLLANATLDPAVEVVGINPHRSEACGVPCVPSAQDLPHPVDTAIILVGEGRAEAAVDDVLSAGARAIVVPGLGNHAATRREREAIAARVAAAGPLMIGPDCMGVAVPGAFSPWIGTLPPGLRRGGLAVASQSGGVAEAIVALGARYRLRLVASVGQERTFDVAAACECFARDPETDVVGLFVETIRRPAAMRRALAALAEAGKPVVCLKVGRSQAAARVAAIHSGADVGDPAAFAAFARSTELIVADDFAVFLETLALLQGKRRPRGRRVAAVAMSGGEGALLADSAESAGVTFPAPSDDLAARLAGVRPHGVSAVNPVDVWRDGDTELALRQACEALAAADEYDILVAVVDQTPALSGLEVANAEAMTRSLLDAARAHDLPAALVSSVPSEPIAAVARLADAADVAMLRGAGPALRAIALVGGQVERHSS